MDFLCRLQSTEPPPAFSDSYTSCEPGPPRPASSPSDPPMPASSPFGTFPSNPPKPASSPFSTTAPSDPPKPADTAAPLPTDVAALHSMVRALLADVKATTSVNTLLAATVARLQASQSPATSAPATTATPTPASTTSSTPAPATPPHPPLDNPRTIASGRGCASPELFQRLIRTNWHGRLGRAHMVDVDSLAAPALAELDCLVRRKLHAMFPRGAAHTGPDADTIFASLAALGLRLEDRGAYADLPIAYDNTLYEQPTLRRGTNFSAHYVSKGKWGEYWQGVALETVLELAKYRGLLDEEGFVKAE